MSNISIKDVPDHWVDALRQRAVVGHGPGGHPIIRQGWKSVDPIAAELA